MDDSGAREKYRSVICSRGEYKKSFHQKAKRSSRFVFVLSRASPFFRCSTGNKIFLFISIFRYFLFCFSPLFFGIRLFFVFVSCVFYFLFWVPGDSLSPSPIVP